MLQSSKFESITVENTRTDRCRNWACGFSLARRAQEWKQVRDHRQERQRFDRRCRRKQGKGVRGRTRTLVRPYRPNPNTPFSHYGAANKRRNAYVVGSDDNNNPPMFRQARFGVNRGGFSRPKSLIRPPMGHHVNDDEEEKWKRRPIRK